jgi:hypothetical protein
MVSYVRIKFACGVEVSVTLQIHLPPAVCVASRFFNTLKPVLLHVNYHPILLCNILTLFESPDYLTGGKPVTLMSKVLTRGH